MSLPVGIFDGQVSALDAYRRIKCNMSNQSVIIHTWLGIRTGTGDSL